MINALPSLKMITITTYRLKGKEKGLYRLVVWVGDEKGIHGKIETYKVRGIDAARTKRDHLTEFWNRPENVAKAGNGLRSDLAP